MRSQFFAKMSFFYNEKRGSLSFSYRNNASTQSEYTSTFERSSSELLETNNILNSDDLESDGNSSVPTQLTQDSKLRGRFQHRTPAVEPKTEIPIEESINSYSVLASMLLFIAFHTAPVLERLTAILQVKMGSFLSVLVLAGISSWVGNYLAKCRESQYQTYLNVLQHRSFKGCRSLVLLCLGLYAISYVVSWIFQFLFSVYDRVPLLGSLVVMGTIVWISTILVFVTCYWLGSFTWSITSTAFNLVFGPGEDSPEKATAVKKRRSRLRLAATHVS